MYPPMVEQAAADNHKAKFMFNFAVKAEAVHARLYQAALDAVKQGKDLAETKFYLCPVCGHIRVRHTSRRVPPSAAPKPIGSSSPRRRGATPIVRGKPSYPSRMGETKFFSGNFPPGRCSPARYNQEKQK